MNAARKGLQDDNRVPPLPPFPTSATPGTEQKIAEMEWRVGQGYQPHHPNDYVEMRRKR